MRINRLILTLALLLILAATYIMYEYIYFFHFRRSTFIPSTAAWDENNYKMHTQTHTRPCLSVCVRSYSIAVFTQVCRDCMVCIRVYSLITTTYRCMIVFETSAVKGGRKHACALKSWSLILTFKFFVLYVQHTYTRTRTEVYLNNVYTRRVTINVCAWSNTVFFIFYFKKRFRTRVSQ